MSKLAVANIIFESTESNRIEYTGNNVIRVRANGGFQLPYGTTAQRASPETGLIRYNTDTGLVESYGTGGWMEFPDGNYVNAISDKATAGLVVANAAFASANNVAPQVTPSYNTANAAFNTANAAYASANNVAPQVTPAFNTGNNAYLTANAAYGYANASNTYAESTFLKLTAPNQTVTGNLSVTGNFTLLGNATSISSNNLIVGDSMIYLAANNYSGTDILDIGFVANYANGTGANVHTGLLRDATNKQYYLFQGLDIELQANNTAFTPGANGVVNAVLNADLVTSNLTLGGANAINWIGAAYGAANNVSTQIAPSYNTANAAYNQNNVIFGVANSAYGKANTGLQNTSMTIAGDIKIAGNFAVNNFIEFDTTIGYNYTITTGRNAFTAGPVSIANGNTVTIPSGSYWTVT